MSITAIILDLLVIVAFALAVFLGFKRGFISELLHLGGYLITMVGAFFLSRLLSPMIFTHMVRPGLIETITDRLTEAGSGVDIQSAIQEISNRIPDFLQSDLLNGQDLSYFLQGLTGEPGNIAVNLVDTLIQPTVLLLIECLLFLVLFIILRLIIQIVMKVAQGINGVPVVGTINGLFGGLLGLVHAVGYLLVLGMLVNGIILLTNSSLSWLDQTTVDSTNLFLIFYRFNPLTWF